MNTEKTTFRQGLDDTSKDALKVRLCWVVRIVRGLLGRLLSGSSDRTRLLVTLPDSSSSSSSSSSLLPFRGQTRVKSKCLFTYRALKKTNVEREIEKGKSWHPSEKFNASFAFSLFFLMTNCSLISKLAHARSLNWTWLPKFLRMLFSNTEWYRVPGALYSTLSRRKSSHKHLNKNRHD